MSEEQQEPKSTDAVLGGETTPQRGAVLGGIEGLKKQLERSNQAERFAIFQQAVDYGDEGLKLVYEASIEEKQKLAKNPNTPDKLLQQLAQDQDREVRREVAEHIDCPAEVLQQLAQDQDRRVCDRVADNPNTPVKVLQQLAQDKSEEVREIANDYLREKGSS